jgi:cyanophycinase
MGKSIKGQLLLSGGAQVQTQGETVLEVVAATAREQQQSLLLITAATAEPERVNAQYREQFQQFGVTACEVLTIRSRRDACMETAVQQCANAGIIIFTGGDQLRLTSQLGDSPVFHCLRAHYQQGGMIVGMAAGAAALAYTMIIGGIGHVSPRRSELDMAAGLGLLPDVVLDSHFAERGRLSRLVGAVAHNPRTLGLGLDADTAILVERNERFQVIGTGAVYIIDGSQLSYTSLSEAQTDQVITAHDVTVHVLTAGERFDLIARSPQGIAAHSWR